jgi:hypothetical protein
MNIMSVRKAATGWTIRTAESVSRTPCGRSKDCEPSPMMAAGYDLVQFLPRRHLLDFGWKCFLTCLVADAEVAASVAFAEPQDAKGNIFKGGQRDRLDDGRRENGNEEQRKGCKEQDGQRRGRSQHVGGRRDQRGPRRQRFKFGGCSRRGRSESR